MISKGKENKWKLSRPKEDISYTPRFSYLEILNRKKFTTFVQLFLIRDEVDQENVFDKVDRYISS